MEVCYIVMKQDATYGNAAPVFATTNESVAIEKEQEFMEENTYVMEVPFEGEKEVIHVSDDGLEPLGCHGCGDW